MKLPGRYWKSNKFWLIEVPALDILTQGTTQKEALLMIKDATESLINNDNVEIAIHQNKKGEFTISCNQNKYLIALMLKRIRRANSVTIQEIINKLGLSSKNSYAQYEQAKSEPTLSKISQFLEAINPSLQISAFL